MGVLPSPSTELVYKRENDSHSSSNLLPLASIFRSSFRDSELHLQQGLSVWSLQKISMPGNLLYSLLWTKSSLHGAREVSQQIQFLLRRRQRSGRRQETCQLSLQRVCPVSRESRLHGLRSVLPGLQLYHQDLHTGRQLEWRPMAMLNHYNNLLNHQYQ